MRKLKQDIINLCNESRLPLEALFFIIKDIQHELVEVLEQQDKQQLEQAAQEQNDNEEEVVVNQEKETIEE